MRTQRNRAIHPVTPNNPKPLTSANPDKCSDALIGQSNTKGASNTSPCAKAKPIQTHEYVPADWV